MTTNTTDDDTRDTDTIKHALEQDGDVKLSSDEIIEVLTDGLDAEYVELVTDSRVTIVAHATDGGNA